MPAISKRSRLSISALVAFVFYAAWAWFANSMATSNIDILAKAALVQGSYSALVTLIFTGLLEYFYDKHGSRSYCLAFIVPTLNGRDKQTQFKSELYDHAIGQIENLCNGACLPGMLVSPLPALLLQSIFVIVVNVVFATPNLWLTVLPSIAFSAIYGYSYSFAIGRQRSLSKQTNS